MVRISYQLQLHQGDEQAEHAAPLTGEDLLMMGKYSHLLLHSTILPRFVERIDGVLSQAMAIEL
jgi:hypothetical protein